MGEMTDKITSELYRVRRALPFPNAIEKIALHGATERYWAAELAQLLGAPKPGIGVQQFMGFNVVVDATLPVNRIEFRSGARVLARCDLTLHR